MPTPEEALAEARRLAESLSPDPLSPIRMVAEQFIAQNAEVAGSAAEAAQEAATGAAGGMAASRATDSARAAAEGISRQLATPASTPEARRARAAGLRQAWESVRNNPNVPEAVREQLANSLADAEAGMEDLETRRQESAEFSGSVVGQDEQVDAVTGRPVPGYVQRMVRQANTDFGTPEALARDGVTAPATGPGSVTGTPTPGQPPTATGARPRGTGGGRPRPQTASIAEQLLAALQNGSPDQDEILQRLVDSYRREATTRDDFGEQGSIVVDAGLQEQQELAQARREEFEQELIAQERRLQEIDTALGVLSSTRFDANRLFTDRGLATSMALGVAVNAATSLAQNALFPGANAGNTALQIVNGAIERDIQTQMVNYERGVQSVQGMRTAYEMARNLSQDRQAAYEFAAAISQRRVGEQLRGMAMQTQGLVAREQLMRQADSLLLQAAQREELARMQMAQAMFANQPRGAGGGTGRLQSQLFAPFIRITEAAQRAGIRTPADVLKALGTAGADRLRDFASASADAIDLIDRITRTMEGYSSFSMVDRATMENLIVNLQGILKDQMQFGALDTGVERTLNRMLGNPNSFTETRAEFLARMRNQRAITMSRIRRRVEALGGGIAGFDVTAGMTAPQDQEPGVTIVGETPPQETTLGSVATAEGSARVIRAIQGAIGETGARALFGNATIDALAGGE